MKSIRKLYFQNDSGERWGLNGENGVYCTDLAGFGFSFEASFADIGNGFFSGESKSKDVQSAIPFTFVFVKDPYGSYQMLMDWLSGSDKLTIVYDPTGRQEYFKDVVVEFAQKGELNKVGWLEVPCSFLGVTPWYLSKPTLLSIQSAGKDDRKKYTYQYTSTLKYGMDSASALSAIIAGAGHIPAALEMIYYGAIKNPKVKLVGNITGKTFGVCSITTVLEKNDVLVFSTKYESSSVKKIDSAGVETDLLDVLDLSLTPFFHVPVNEPCTISVESDDFFSGRAEIFVYYYYRSV